MVIKKDKFTFGSIFDESVQEYKNNFKVIFKFMLLFFGVPSLIFAIIKLGIYAFDSNLLSMLITPSLLTQLDQGAIKLPFYFQLITIVFSLISICLSVFISAGFISTSLKKSKFSFRDIINNGLSKYGKFFLFNLVILIFLVLLTLLLIIPGIIFGIYWVFASYVFFDKKENILPSLKQSRMIVKGRWWKTLGYLILIGLILVGISLIVNIIQFPAVIIMTMRILNGTSLSLGFLGISSLLDIIASFIAGLITIPFGVFFFKNLYVKMKK